MSARTSRSSQREPSSARKERPPSPLSPHKISRIDEKKTLGNLNDRLASYIEKVRSLELDKGLLQKQVSTIEEVKTKEIVTMKNNYARELNLLRSCVDDTSKQKAKLEIELESLKIKDKEMTKKLKDKEDELSRVQYTNQKQDKEILELNSKLNTANADLSNLRPEVENLRNKLNDSRQKLEDETIQRIDLQNKLLTVKEEAEFNSKNLQEQLNETRQRKQIEIEEVDSRIQTHYDSKFKTEIQEMRDHCDREIAENRKSLEDNYGKKINDLKTRLNAEMGTAASSLQEKKEFETRVEGMTSKMRQLEATNEALDRRIKELVEQMDDMGKQHRAQSALKDREIDFIKEELENLTKDYSELVEIKIALDLEISTYRKMLESEETRMGLSPSSQETSSPPRKRKRIDLEESYIGVKMNTTFNQPGALLIQPLEDNKNCIRIENTGEEDVNLGGLNLTCISDEVESNYKFTRTHKIAAGATISVYSSDAADVEHAPSEGVLKMKTGAWKMGDEVNITLVNKEGEELASRETNWEKEVMGGSQSFIGDIDRPTVTQKEGEKCSIM